MKLWFTERQTEGLALSLKVKDVLFCKRSGFQEIAVVETEEFGRLLALDGAIMTTERDEFIYHEMLVHPAMFLHPNPERVLVIGGGDGGAVREILKHRSVRNVTLVEIDIEVVEASKRFLPAISEALSDGRVQIFAQDGKAFVKERSGEFDVIIVDSTDPVGPAEGLFAEEFIRDAYSALREKGVLVEQTESPILHLDFISRVFGIFKDVFGQAYLYTAPVPTYPSGFWSFTIGFKGFSPDLSFEAVDFEGRYFNREVAKASFALPTFLRRALGVS